MSSLDVYDTNFTVQNAGAEVEWGKEKESEHWRNFIETMSFLGSIGFYVGENKRVKKEFPILNWSYRYGRYADLEFEAEFHPVCFKIEFFQNVFYENPNGGQYDFDKRKKMPYLIGKQFDLTQKKLIEFLENKGFSVRFKENKKAGAAFIVEDYIRSWHHPQKEWFALSEIDGQTVEYSYNNTDRDKKTIYNGQVKYCRDYSGYLQRGIVYHNINNMWWVLLPCGTVENVRASDLFDISDIDVRGRAKIHNPPKEYTERKKRLSECSIKELKNELKRRNNGEKF